MPPGAPLEHLRPRGREKEQRPFNLNGEGVEKVEQIVFCPVDVFNQHDRRALPRELLQELGPGVVQALARGEWVEALGNVEAFKKMLELHEAGGL